MDGLDDLTTDGLPPGRDCPACGQPLEPGHTDSSIALIWLCPSHGPVGYTADAFLQTD